MTARKDGTVSTTGEKARQIIEFLETTFMSSSELAKEVGCTTQYVDRVKKSLDVVACRSKRVDVLRERMMKLIIDKIDFYNESMVRADFLCVLRAIETLSKIAGLNAPTEAIVTIRKWPDEIVYEIEPEIKDGRTEG